MPKYLITRAALAALISSTANAQQQEDMLQRVQLNNAGFDMVVAVARPGGSPSNFGARPEFNLVYLADGELVHAYTGRLRELSDSGALMPAACSFNVERRDYSPGTPVTIHVVPKGVPVLATATR